MANHLEDLTGLSIRSVRDGLTAKHFSASELADASFARIEALEPGLHAFNSLSKDLASAAACRIDALVAAGSNQIDGPSFSIADPKPLLAKAHDDLLDLSGRKRRRNMLARAAHAF